MTRARLLLAAAVALLALAAGAQAASAADLLPDLVADPPDGEQFQVYDYGTGQSNLLLRFNGYVHNAGAGPLEIDAQRVTSSDPLVPVQTIYASDGSSHPIAMPSWATLEYANADGHHHWHLNNVALYSLWDAARTHQVAPAMKVGFCLMDSDHIDDEASADLPVYTDVQRHFCQQNQPDALTLWEGVSGGWRDIYASNLSWQWVVVSDVQPGQYWLREDVDPDGIIRESNETNAPSYAADPTVIPGYVAKAVTAPATPYGQAQQVALGADQYGSPGARSFRIVTPPAHGTLDVAAGTVTYTPASGWSGPDSFTYAAADSTSPYPLHPGTATVALNVGAPAPSVVISGAPSTLVVGHGVQLRAAVAHDAPGVTWKVGGVTGGTAKLGRISSQGFYTAPALVPADSRVTVSAVSASGALDRRSIEIVAAKDQPAAPTPPGGSGGSKRLSPIAAGLAGRALVVAVTPRRAGILTLAASAAGRGIGACRRRVPAGRRVACRIRVHGRPDMRRLKVVARLTAHGKLLARRTRVGAPLQAHARGKEGLRTNLGLSRAAAAFLGTQL